MFNRKNTFNKKKAAERSQLYLDMLKGGTYGELRLFWPDDSVEDRLNSDQRRIYAITYDVKQNKYCLWSGLSYRSTEPELKQEVSVASYEQAFVGLLKMASGRLEHLGGKPTSMEEFAIFTVNVLEPITNETILNLLSRLEQIRFIIYPWLVVPVQDWVVGNEPYSSRGQKVPYWHKK